MSNFIDVYSFSQSLFGEVPQEYSIVYFIVSLALIIGILIVIFSPFILIGKLINR